MREVLGDDAYQALLHRVEDVLSGRTVTFERQVPYRFGGTRYVNGTYIPHLSDQGSAKGFVVLVQDVTERTEALREIESIAKFPGENPNPVLRISPDGLLLYANGSSSLMVESLGWRVGTTLPSDWRQRMNEVMGSGTCKELEVECDSKVYALTLTPVLGLGYINIYGKDITERKQMEEELRSARDELELRVEERTSELHKTMESLRVERQRFNDVLDVLPVYVVLLTPDHHVSFANKVFRQRFGESRGLCCFDHLFGRSEPCEVCDSFTVLKTMKPHQWEWTGPDSRSYDVFDFPFTETDGSTFILEMGIDITERKRAEESLNAYTARLKLLNTELQEFAFIASHDLQEPLRKIQAFGERLRTKCEASLGEEGCDYLHRIESAADRMSSLLSALLAYSRVETRGRPFTKISLARAAQDAVSDLELAIEDVGGKVEVGPLPAIEADPDQMRQLFQNFIGNALRYHREGERPVIRVHGSIGDGVVQILIEDDGIGFDEKYLDRIFRPFQRLHGRTSPYKGTGMGLAICRKIVERHGGSIAARSTPGVGSAFIVTLPVKQKSNVDDQPQPSRA
jgi:signal transduction histidine kinase